MDGHAHSRRGITAVDYPIAGYMLLVAALEPTAWWTIPNYAFAVVAILLALRVAKTGRVSEAVLRDPVIWIGLLLVVWLGICAGQSPNPAQARGAVVYLGKVLTVGAVVLAGATDIRRVRLWLVAFWVGVAGLAWGTVATIAHEGFIGGLRTTGLARQENVLGQAMVAGIAVSILLMTLARPLVRRLLLLQIGVFLVALLASGSRGAAVSAIAIVAAYVAFEQLPRLRRYVLHLLAALGSGVILVVATSGLLAHTPVVVRFRSTLSSGLGSVGNDPRWEIYTHSWALFRENMLFGVGLGNYQLYNPIYVYTHSAPLELLVGGGVLGAVIYYVMVVGGFVRCIRAARLFRGSPGCRAFFHAAAALVVGVIVQGAFSLTFNSKHFTILFFLLVGIARAALRTANAATAATYTQGGSPWRRPDPSVKVFSVVEPAEAGEA